VAAVTSKRNAQALEILAQKDSRFLFHHPKELIDGRIQNYRGMQSGEAAYRRMIESYADYGVSKRWLRNVQRYFAMPEGFYQTAEQLCLGATHVLPADACSSLDADTFLNQIINVYGDNGRVSTDPMIQNSILRTLPDQIYNFFVHLLPPWG
jgi:hypothetical protein